MSYSKEGPNAQNIWTTLYDREVKETRQWLCLKWRVIKDTAGKEAAYRVLANEAYVNYNSDDKFIA